MRYGHCPSGRRPFTDDHGDYGTTLDSNRPARRRPAVARPSHAGARHPCAGTCRRAGSGEPAPGAGGRRRVPGRRRVHGGPARGDRGRGAHRLREHSPIHAGRPLQHRARAHARIRRRRTGGDRPVHDVLEADSPGARDTRAAGSRHPVPRSMRPELRPIRGGVDDQGERRNHRHQIRAHGEAVVRGAGIPVEAPVETRRRADDRAAEDRDRVTRRPPAGRPTISPRRTSYLASPRSGQR